MAQKYLCPHCKKEVSETDIMGGLCPSCHRLFIKPLSADNFPGEFQTAQNRPVYTPQKIQKIDLTKEFDNSDVVGKTCPYCQTPIKPGVSTVTCPKCNIPHHKECWEENGGCTTYGCQYSGSPKPQPAPSFQPSPGICPSCGRQISAGQRFCSGCGREIQQGTVSRTPSGISQSSNTSGQGATAEIPPEIRRWNWGAFWLSFIWSVCNNVWIGLLTLLPGACVVMPFVLGAKGNEWAWQNKRWESVEHFQRVQRAWANWALGIVILFSIIVALSSFVMNS